MTAFLCEEFEQKGRRVAVAATGFKSLVQGTDSDFHLLIHDRSLFKLVSLVPGVVHAQTLLQRRGASFRTERYPEFAQEANLQRAAATIVERGVRVLVTIGGNGTFAGTMALAKLLPASVQLFFGETLALRVVCGCV